MNPRQRRGWVEHVQHVFRVSQRRACRGLHVARSTCRYVFKKRADEPAIVQRMTEIAGVRVRYGYRRIHVLMAREGWRINHKRLYRLYTQTGLNLRMKRPRRHISAAHRAAQPSAAQRGEVWAMDFIATQLYDGRRLRALTVVDVFTRECLAILVDQALKGADVVATMRQVSEIRGSPSRIQVDNGSEFVSKVLDLWAYQCHVTLDFSRPGKPTDNPFIESFHGSFRDECLNTHWFLSLDDARRKVEHWRREYNSFRPHSALKNLAPSAFAAQFASVHVQPEIPI